MAGVSEFSGRSVIVTRPMPGARRWADALTEAGYPVWVLPLIRIESQPDQTATAQARAELGDFGAVMFVSSAAVEHFFARNESIPPGKSCFEAIKTRAWAPGPGTARSLLACGWPADRIDTPAADAAHFDSESLWACVEAQVQPGFRLLLVRGADEQGRSAGRDWLSDQVQSRGGVVRTVAVYRRCAPVFTPAESARALAGAIDGSIWLFSSSEGVSNLMQALPQAGWIHARALATHPRIAQAARQAGFGEVRQAHPTVDGVLRSLESDE